MNEITSNNNMASENKADVDNNNSASHIEDLIASVSQLMSDKPGRVVLKWEPGNVLSGSRIYSQATTKIVGFECGACNCTCSSHCIFETQITKDRQMPKFCGNCELGMIVNDSVLIVSLLNNLSECKWCSVNNTIYLIKIFANGINNCHNYKLLFKQYKLPIKSLLYFVKILLFSKVEQDIDINRDDLSRLAWKIFLYSIPYYSIKDCYYLIHEFEFADVLHRYGVSVGYFVDETIDLNPYQALTAVTKDDNNKCTQDLFQEVWQILVLETMSVVAGKHHVKLATRVRLTLKKKNMHCV